MKKIRRISLLCFILLQPALTLHAQNQSIFIYDPSGNYYQSLHARLPYFFQGNVVRITSLDSSIQNYHAGFLLDPPVLNQTQTNILKYYLNNSGRLYIYSYGFELFPQIFLQYLGFGQITGLLAGTCVDTTIGQTGTFTEGLRIYQPISFISQFFTVTGTVIPILQAKCPIWFNHYSAFASVSDTFKAIVDIYNYTYDGNFLKRLLTYFDLDVIPVELISFEAEEIEGGIILKWITATETNNKGFEIERKHAEHEWLTIGLVPGNGTTTEPNHYSFNDNEVTIGNYQYRLKQIDYDGSFEYSKVVEVEVGLPDRFELFQNYPNPFNPVTKIKYVMPCVGAQCIVPLQINVYDVLGNKVAALVNEQKPAGSYEVEFDGRGLASGIYFYQLKTGNFINTKKMILLR